MNPRLNLVQLVRKASLELAQAEFAAAKLANSAKGELSYSESTRLCAEVCDAVFRFQLACIEIERLARRRWRESKKASDQGFEA